MENGTSTKESTKLKKNNLETETENDENSQLLSHPNNQSMDNKENNTPNQANSHAESNDSPKTQRRSDEPTELKFEKFPENAEEKAKRKLIEEALVNPNTTIEQWKSFAKSEYGLVADDLRKSVWPLLLNLDVKQCQVAPKLSELSHKEYDQVVLDVNRSLKRFPPGIPYEQRVALQDQLTVLILRVITKYPHLNYYQGYHDVAITFLLVAGEDVAFHIMEILSTEHLVECMQKTFETVQKRLLIIFATVWRENIKLYEFLERSEVGLMFALPWFLTWFGHSLNQYRSVVRLYDFFLASEPLLPLYVTAAIVLYREEDVFREDCDRASLHCLLSQLPDDLPFEYLLTKAESLYAKYSPEQLEKDIAKIILREKQMRDEENRLFEKRRQMLINRKNPPPLIYRLIPHVFLLNKRSIVVTTAFSIFVGICAYYYKTNLSFNVDIIR